MQRKFILLAAGALLGACSTFSSDADLGPAPAPTTDAGSDVGAVVGQPGLAEFGLQTPTNLTYLVQGQQASVKLHVPRGALLTEQIKVKLTNLPKAAGPAEVVVPARATDIDIVLTAAADTPQGPVKIVLEGVAVQDGQRVTATTALDLFVRGPSGSIDTTFGSQGHVTGLSAGAEPVVDVMIGPKDELYIVSACGGVCVSRRTMDGVLDPKFGTGGKVQRQGIEPYVARVQSDGRVLVGGRGTSKPVAACRFNSDGTTDTAFGNSGEGPGSFSMKPASGFATGINQIALGSNGALGLSFAWDLGSNHSVAGILRTDANGGPLATFGSGGLATWDGSPFSTNVRALAFKSSGALLVAAVTGTTVGTSYAATQLDAAGATDPTFGTGGTVSATFPNANSLLATRGYIAFLDGSLIFPVANQNTGRLVKLSAAGQFDNAFGSVGALDLVNDAGSALAPLGVARAPDGQVVVLATEVGLPGGATLFRMSPIGARDKSFGGGAGNAIIATAPGPSSAFVVVQSDKRIVVLTDLDSLNFDALRLWD